MRQRVVWIAWVLASILYFYQYSLRSAPASMLPDLSEGFKISIAGAASIAALFYYGYALFGLVAGVAIDRLGARAVILPGAFTIAAGVLLFASGNAWAASVGRLLQGAGGACALIGAIYIASVSLPAARAATLIGATQMFGMAGGATGPFAAGALITHGFSWRMFWIWMGLAGVVLAILLTRLLPDEELHNTGDSWIASARAALRTVFANPQTILSGLIAGLLFLPTTIFDMIWGVRFLEQAHGFDYSEAVLRSATVPVGWVIGCPLMGLLSDKLGRRKPVVIGASCALMACLAWILYGDLGAFPPYVLGLLVGIFSSAAMILFTVSKESNLPEHAGTSASVVNLFNFGLSALTGPAFAQIMQSVSETNPSHIERYQITFQPLLYGVALAILLTFVLKETGPAARVSLRTAEAI
jgi:MFS family permease